VSDMNGGPPVLEEPVKGSNASQQLAEPVPVTQTATTAPPPVQPPGGTVNASAQRPLPEGARRGGIWFGVVLIALGALMLVGRYAPWGYILRLWPLIIVIGGITQVLRPHGDAAIKRIAEGLGTIATGVVLLCNSFGVIPWSVWLNMLSLWPMLIVALGVELVGRGLKLDWVRALSNVLLILTLFYGAFVLGPEWHGGVFSLAPVSGEAVTIDQKVPHDPSVATGDASINLGAMRLTIGPGDSLAAIRGNAAKGTESQLLTHGVVDGKAEIEINDESDGVVMLPYPDRSLDVTLDRAVQWDGVVLSLGATDADVDLRELHVKSVHANVGASNLRLSIGSKAPAVSVEIAGGATAVTIRVPKDASVTVESQSGLSAVSVPDTFEHVSGIAVIGESRWSKKGSGGPTIAISLKSGVSSLEILTY